MPDSEEAEGGGLDGSQARQIPSANSPTPALAPVHTAISDQEVLGRYAAPREHSPQLKCTEDGRRAMPTITDPRTP
ncbi:hypothetical protein FJTKL_09130 [Diaporthe vaccinii]|uniref:Uncharacterized protein n=1 Tax=Diaporthe vaccinii TaxID=105482 RepID=A0ABR4ENZ0_9PEZI